MILQVLHSRRGSSPVTYVVAEGCVRDVAAYEAPGHVSGDEALRVGVKLTHRAALERGLRWSADKHYRL